MTPVTCFAGRAVALFGLGGSGLVTAQALIAGGAKLTAWDDGQASRTKAQEAGIPLGDLQTADWPKFAALILTPGVPLTHPAPHWAAQKATAAGVEIIGDVELFCRERKLLNPQAPFIAITGTNGKSTTTALIAHLFKATGYDVQMGGNIGIPILALAPPAANRVHIIECSSFQIDLTPSINPTIGILSNLTPDHIDRHGTMENYAAVKERLIQGADLAVVGVDDAACAAICARRTATGRPTVPVSVKRALDEGVFLEGSHIIAKRAGTLPGVLGDVAGISTLRGQHNAQNACLAVAAADAFKIDAHLIQQGLKSFPGLPHRMEEVGHLGHVLFINDSKATNADATEKALLSFEDIFWILGGKAKEGGIEPLEPLFARVRKAYLIGEAADQFATTLKGHCETMMCGTLERAVAAAAREAASWQMKDLLQTREDPTKPAKQAVVLLSPACASYDQFRNFEVRGDAFRSHVQTLMGTHP